MPEALLPCPYHGADAVCDRCPQRFTTDGAGFPSGVATRGLRRMRHCPACGELVTLEQWDRRPCGERPFPKLTRWQCTRCSAEDDEAAGSRPGQALEGSQ
jgi:hypothetical protein